MPTKKRKYYKSQSDPTLGVRVFIVRYKDLIEGEIHNEGPYQNESVATEKLNSFLKKGVCSWLVTYDG